MKQPARTQLSPPFAMSIMTLISQIKGVKFSLWTSIEATASWHTFLSGVWPRRTCLVNGDLILKRNSRIDVAASATIDKKKNKEAIAAIVGFRGKNCMSSKRKGMSYLKIHHLWRSQCVIGSVACCGAVTSPNFGLGGNKAFYIAIVNICDIDHT